MLARFKTYLTEARQERRRLQPPRIRVAVLTTVAGLALAVALGYLFGGPENRSVHFEEFGAITALSSLLMAMAAALSGTAFFLLRTQPRRLSWFWLLSSFGFLFFAMDELLQFHERIGIKLGGHDPNNSGPLFFRNWNDVIVIGYGLVAVVVCGIFLPEIMRMPNFAKLVAIGGAFYVVHTALDSVMTRSVMSVVVEETMKLFSAGFFALAFFSAVLGATAVSQDRQDRQDRAKA